MLSRPATLGPGDGGCKAIIWLRGAVDATWGERRGETRSRRGTLITLRARYRIQRSRAARLRTQKPFLIPLPGVGLQQRAKQSKHKHSRHFQNHTVMLYAGERQTKSVPLSVLEQPPTAALLSHTATISHDHFSASHPRRSPVEPAPRGRSSLISNLAPA